MVSSSDKDPTSRPLRILALGAPVGNFYEVEYWRGVHSAAREFGVSLTYVSGGIQHIYFDGIPPIVSANESRSTLLYQLVDKTEFDGVVFWGAQHLHDGNEEDLARLVKFFEPLPVASLGWHHEAVISCMPDNYSPMRDNVKHLIEVHGHQKIVYLNYPGPHDTPESRARFRGYCDALADHKIPLDERLIYDGRTIDDLTRVSYGGLHRDEFWGMEAIKVLLDERGLVPGRDFTALAAFNDRAVEQAMTELEMRGFRIPADLGAVGFDDIPSARSRIPTLTTVNQLFFQQARLTLRMLVERIRYGAGHKFDFEASLHMRHIIGESCGCMNQIVKQSTVDPVPSTELVKAWPSQAAILYLQAYDGAKHVFESPARALEVLALVSKISNILSAAGIDPMELNTAIRMDRQFVQKGSPDDEALTALNLLFTDALHRMQLSERIVAAERQNRLDAVTGLRRITYDLKDILNSIQVRMHELVIRGLAIVLFSDPTQPDKGGVLIFSQWDGVRQDIDPLVGRAYDSITYINSHLGPSTHRPTRLFYELLLFGAERIGYLVTEPEENITAVKAGLSAFLSPILKGFLLVRELQRANAEIAELAKTDALTGLINRRSFQDIIEHECLRADRYETGNGQIPSLMFIDLDNFKNYNDTFGHDAGDAVLVVFAHLLRRSCRISDRICRYGGDEFAVLMPETTEEGAQVIAERIFSELADSDAFETAISNHLGRHISLPREQRINTSIGIATYGRGNGYQKFIKTADEALYLAKKAGKGQFKVKNSEIL